MALALKPKALTHKEKIDLAVQEYIANNIVANNLNYSWNNALEKVGYNKRYIQSYSSKLWKSIEPEITSFKNKIAVNVQRKLNVTVEWVVQQHLETIEEAKQKGDLATKTANIIKIGETIAAYKSASVNTNLDIQLSQNQIEIAERIERLLQSQENVKPALIAENAQNVGNKTAHDEPGLKKSDGGIVGDTEKQVQKNSAPDSVNSSAP